MKEKTYRIKGPEFYDRIYNGSPRYKIKPWGVQPTYEKLLKMSEGPLLEVGCGTGQFAAWVQNRMKYVLGIDFSKVGVEMARERCPDLDFVHGDIFDHAEIFSSLNYRTVIMYEVLEHIENDLGLLELIPHGKKIVFGVPNYDAMGHVRYFEDIQDVKDRYGKHIMFADEDMQGNGKSRTIFILGGIKA